MTQSLDPWTEGSLQALVAATDKPSDREPEGPGVLSKPGEQPA